MICEHCKQQIKEPIGITKIEQLKGKLVRRQIIIDTILEYYGYKNISELSGKARHHPMVTHRQILMTFLKLKTNMICKEIGNLLGNRDHTTVLNSLLVIDDLLFSDPDIRFDVTEINNRLNIEII